MPSKSPKSKSKQAVEGSSAPKATSVALDNLVSILDLETARGEPVPGPQPAAGLATRVRRPGPGPSLVAAVRTVEPGRIAHSLHAYFLLGGDPRSRSSIRWNACAMAAASPRAA